jgi:hypothetical protein
MDLPTNLNIRVDTVSGAIVGIPEGMSASRRRMLTDAYTENGWRWWSLSPMDQVDNTREDETGGGRRTVKSMLRCIGMRRGMDTIMRLPDHEDGTQWLVSPRDGIPPHHIETHSLSYVDLKAPVDKFMNDHFQDLAVSSASAGPQDMSLTLHTGGKVSATDDGGEGPESGGNLNAGLLRILSIASIDFLSIMAMIKEDTIAKLPDDVLLSDLVELGECSGRAPERARRQTQDAAHSSGVLTFGSAHTESILQGTGDYGLTYLQLLALGDNIYDFTPVERKTVLSRVLARSPVFTHVVKLCIDRAVDGKRTLVMVSTPWIQL